MNHAQALTDTSFPGQAPPRVFLLEDNDANAMVIEGFLETLGCEELTHVSTLAELAPHITDILAGDYDLVIFDIALPDGESLDVARRIIPDCPCPVVAYTAQFSGKEKQLYQQAGFATVFAKPLSLSDFQNGFEAIMGG